MDVFSTYEVRIGDGDRNSLSTTTSNDFWTTITIADSSELIENFMVKMGNQEVSIGDEQNGVQVVGLSIEYCDDNNDAVFFFKNDDGVSIPSINTNNKVATLQLCWGSFGLLVQLLHLEEIPNSLKILLANDHKKHLFVGVGIKDVFAKLERDYGLICKSGIELGLVASRVYKTPHYFDSNLEILASEIARINIEKPRLPSLTFWSAKDLRIEQIEYAITKAYASFSIGEMMMKMQVKK